MGKGVVREMIEGVEKLRLGPRDRERRGTKKRDRKGLGMGKEWRLM